MSKTNSFETSILELIFLNQGIANIGDTTGLVPSTADGNLYLALFTADPTETGSTANEATYTGYARIPVNRTTGWDVTANVASNVTTVTFDTCTAGTNTITHAAVVDLITGGTVLLYEALNSSLAVSNNVTPEFQAGQITITEE